MRENSLPAKSCFDDWQTFQINWQFIALCWIAEMQIKSGVRRELMLSQ